MAHYRLYLLDDAGHIRQAVDLDCVDDGEAVARAARYAEGTGTEVWQGTRRVARLPARRIAPEASSAAPTKPAAKPMSIETADRVADDQSGSARHRSSPELDRADIQVASARARVEQVAKLVDDEMRRGSPTATTRDLLTTCQKILREAVAHRDAAFAEFMKGQPSSASDSGSTTFKKEPRPTEAERGTPSSKL